MYHSIDVKCNMGMSPVSTYSLKLFDENWENTSFSEFGTLIWEPVNNYNYSQIIE